MFGTHLKRTTTPRTSITEQPNRQAVYTDALAFYSDAVFNAFQRKGVDYAVVKKTIEYDEEPDGRPDTRKQVTSTKASVFGSPRMERAGTSRIERANLTLRMTQRRWTRRTNAHNKSFTHMQAAFALHACHYNWVRRHMTLGTTPAVVLGVADREWSLQDLVGLLEVEEQVRGTVD